MKREIEEVGDISLIEAETKKKKEEGAAPDEFCVKKEEEVIKVCW